MRFVALLGVFALMLAAAVLVALAVSDDGRAPDEETWWQPLIKFAPLAGDEESILLTNAEAIDGAYGVASGQPCQSGFAANVPQKEVRASGHTRDYYWFLYTPNIGLGFDACQVLQHATIYESDYDQIHVFVTAVPTDEVRTAMLAAGYSHSVESGVELFEPTLDPEVESYLGIWDVPIRYVAPVGEFIITSNNRDSLLRALVAHDAVSSAMVDHDILKTLQPFDAVMVSPPAILPDASLIEVIQRCLSCTDEQLAAIRQYMVISAREAGWSDLPRPDQVAVAFEAGETPTMKLALAYQSSSSGSAARELELRLRTYGSITRGQKLCDSAEAVEQVAGAVSVVVGSCHGGRAESWANTFSVYNASLLLIESME